MKVKFGFKNAYYAKINIDENGGVTYEKPVHMPGAVSLSLAPSGESVEFYADDGLYFSDAGNNGYEGSLELALIPESFKTDILNEVADANGVLVEDATKVTNPFALLCEFTQDDGARKFCFYHCTSSRPSLEATTKGETKEIGTETLNIICRPNKEGIVKISTKADTDETVLTDWYTEVYTGTSQI